MGRERLVSVAALAVVLSVIAGCTQDGRNGGSARSTSPSPTTSGGESSLCQPFPDRLIDEFLAAYNGRNLDALEDLVHASEIEDLVAGAYGGESTFSDVEEWARTAWGAGDRIRNSGYGGFDPSKDGFQMFVTRTSEPLYEAEVDRVSMTLNALTEGCAITSLVSAGPVQAMGDPCAFYESFGSIDDVARAQPRACADGSAELARSSPAVTHAGGRALVWGGSRGGYFTYGDIAMDGLMLGEGSNRATRIRPPEMPPFRPEAEAWTGSALIVIGSKVRGDQRVVAAAYSPEGASWSRIPFPFRRTGGFEGVWTGRELLLWGGPSHSASPPRRGLAYDPFTDEWRKTAPAPGGGRWLHAAVWTGTEMVVFGGGDAKTLSTTGLAYDPATDTWREIAPSPLSPREWLPLVWTGREVLVWGGSSFGRSVANGAAYDPARDSWRRLPRSPLRARHRHSMVWNGSEAIVFGGYDYRRSFSDAAAYHPATDRWRRLPRAPIRPRFDHAATWTGRRMLVFGGTWEAGHIALGDGAWYDPEANRWQRVIPLWSRS